MTQQSRQQTSFIDPGPALPIAEQPRNRLREVGAYGLTSTEVLSLILAQRDHALAHRLHAAYPSLHDLAKAGPDQLTAIRGIGPVQAARLSAALELARRLLLEDASDRTQIRAPSDFYLYLRAFIPNSPREHFVVLNLDTRNRIRHSQLLYTGTVNTSIIRTAEVFQWAVANTATSIAVGHNHPSGDANPSPEDVALTRRLVDVGKILEIPLLDHVILGDNRYVSLRERALGFENL